MSSNLPATTTAKPPKSILMAVATRYQMEPEAFERTLRGTVFPGNGSREEFAAFLVVAERYKLDPITRQIYAFPKKGGGIVPVVGIDGWIHLVNQHPQMNGMEFEYESDEKGVPISCTCRIFRKDRSMPTVVTEFLDECIRPTDPWKMKRRMLRHKALMQCARYAFGFSGIYDEDEAHDIANSADAPLPPPPPPPPRGAIAERDAGTVEDAVIVEPTKPADPKPVDPVEDATGEDEVEFDFDPWIQTVRDAFVTCQSESDVDEAHAEFEETVENILGSEQRMTYQEIHEEALTRVTSPAEEEAPAAPPPPTAGKKVLDDVLHHMRTGKPGAPAMDDEDEVQPLAPGAAYLARGDHSLADPNRTKESINAFWNDTKAERMALKKDGLITADELKAYHGRMSEAWDALDREEKGAQDTIDDAGEDSCGSDMSDQDKSIAAFTAEFEKRMNEIETMTELNSYFSSTLKTRNEFGLEMTDPRKKAWQQLKVDRTAAINSAS